MVQCALTYLIICTTFKFICWRSCYHQQHAHQQHIISCRGGSAYLLQNRSSHPRSPVLCLPQGFHQTVSLPPSLSPPTTAPECPRTTPSKAFSHILQWQMLSSLQLAATRQCPTLGIINIAEKCWLPHIYCGSSTCRHHLSDIALVWRTDHGMTRTCHANRPLSYSWVAPSDDFQVTAESAGSMISCQFMRIHCLMLTLIFIDHSDEWPGVLTPCNVQLCWRTPLCAHARQHSPALLPLAKMIAICKGWVWRRLYV